MPFDQISSNIRQQWGVRASTLGVILKVLLYRKQHEKRTHYPDTSVVVLPKATPDTPVIPKQASSTYIVSERSQNAIHG